MAMSAVSAIGSRESGKETVSPQRKLLDRLACYTDSKKKLRILCGSI